MEPRGVHGDTGDPKELAYMRANSSLSGVQLARGTQPFDPSLVDAILGG